MGWLTPCDTEVHCKQIEILKYSVLIGRDYVPLDETQVGWFLSEVGPFHRLTEKRGEGHREPRLGCF